MKRILIFILVMIITLLPSGAALAQEANQTPEPLPLQCEPEMIMQTLNDLMINLDDALEVVMYLVETLAGCVQPWLNMLFETLLFSNMPSVIEPPSAFNPNDGILTPGEAEYAIGLALMGDLDGANAFFCVTNQLQEEDMLEPLSPEEFTVDCTAGDGTMTCQLDATYQGAPFNVPLTFEVIDGKLCEQLE